MTEKKTAIIIPSRYASTRLHAKPLIEVNGKPIIQWVYEKASAVKQADTVIVATDHEKIFPLLFRMGAAGEIIPVPAFSRIFFDAAFAEFPQGCGVHIREIHAEQMVSTTVNDADAALVNPFNCSDQQVDFVPLQHENLSPRTFCISLLYHAFP